MTLIENADVYIHSSTVFGGGQHNIIANAASNQERVLEALKPVVGTGRDVPRCMEGTRERLFEGVDSWINGPDTNQTPNIMWITGSPGAGKSAIASSLHSILTKQHRLGSSFFFKRGDVNSGDPATLWRTVAFDLTQFHPSIKASVMEFLTQPCFRDTDILIHFECMIEDVLQKHHEELSSNPPVLVLDALDECGSDDSHSGYRRTLLDTLTRWTRLPRIFKLIVTSRDERVPEIFHDPRFCLKVTLETGDLVSHETQHDIRIFFEQSLDHIRPTLGFPPTWPGEPAIEQLTTRAAGLFIWAKTAMAFMEEKHGDPNAKLKLILAGNLGQQGENIDILYKNVLHFAFRNSDDATVDLFRMVVGAIIVAKAPFHRDDLKYLLGRQEDDDDWRLSVILYNLSSVIELDTSLRLRHLSFAEFLQDPNRCPNRCFLIDLSEQHRNMTLASLRIMKTELRFNICELESSHLRNDDVENLASRMATSISTYLAYSCRFWAAHLCEMRVDRTNCLVLLKEVEDFLYVRLLFWLEVMSLIKEIPASYTALSTAAKWIEAFNTDLSSFARDASRFVANFHLPISESVPHIYLSALPFSPRKSLVSKCFLSQFPGTLSIVTGRDDRWPALTNVLTGHSDWVTSVAYSPDGKWLVSGSRDKTVRIWDLETGQTVRGPFKGHQEDVWSVAYSPDGTRVVSGSVDHTLRMWDIESGQMIRDLVGHTQCVMSVAFSPDGKRIVSGSNDQTIRVWDVETGQTVAGPFVGHRGGVKSVVYSPDGTRVISGSADMTVCVWDAGSGEISAGPFTGHSSMVRAVACSPDGKQVVSGSNDQTLRVWDVETGEVAASPFEGHKHLVRSVMYSPDGKSVVSGSNDYTVRIWDIVTGHIIAGPFEGHADWIMSVAFRPDGKQVASGSDDRTIRVWDVDSCQRIPVLLEGHTSAVRSVAYSPDGKHVVSASEDGTLRLWDVETGRMVRSSFEGHANTVWCIAYSPDGKRVVSGTAEKTIYVWDVETGRKVAGPFEGHDDWIQSVAYSPDGSRVVSGSEDQTVRVWDVDTGLTVAGPFTGHTDLIVSVAFSPNGKWVASGSIDKTIRVWDVENGKVVAGPLTTDTDFVLSVAFSPDGKRVASGLADKTVCVWDVEMGSIVAGPFKGHSDWVWSVAYSPDGKRVISGSRDATVRVWDLEAGKTLLGPFEGHTGDVLSIAISPDGKRVVTGSADKTLCVWNIDSGGDHATTTDPSVMAHLSTLHSIGGPNIFGSCRRYEANGWACSAPVNQRSSDGIRPLLFWVPTHARQGLCDTQTLFSLGGRRTQVDLSRFVHGTSWTQCRHRRPVEDLSIPIHNLGVHWMFLGTESWQRILIVLVLFIAIFSCRFFNT